MAPHQKTENSDGQTRESHEAVTENILAREVRYQLTENTHPRQHHDVDGGMRIEPKEVLEQHWIAAGRRIENAHVRQSLKSEQQDRDCDYGRAEDHDQTGRVMGPDE